MDSLAGALAFLETFAPSASSSCPTELAPLFVEVLLLRIFFFLPFFCPSVESPLSVTDCFLGLPFEGFSTFRKDIDVGNPERNRPYNGQSIADYGYFQ